MSHVEDIDIEITDLKALAAAVAELGAIYTPNQKSNAWFGRSVGDYPLPAGFTAEMLGKCEHAISLPCCRYEIGVVRHPTYRKKVQGGIKLCIAVK